MKEYVNFEPKTAAEGALQDVHWSGGGFGYFPTYSLGNVIAGMFYDRIQKDLNLSDVIAGGKLGEIKDWLREHLHRWGATYSPKEIQMKNFGETYNPEHLVKYLERKFLE
jgi:carboxypeptidase Taq